MPSESNNLEVNAPSQPSFSGLTQAQIEKQITQLEVRLGGISTERAIWAPLIGGSQDAYAKEQLAELKVKENAINAEIKALKQALEVGGRSAPTDEKIAAAIEKGLKNILTAAGARALIVSSEEDADVNTSISSVGSDNDIAPHVVTIMTSSDGPVSGTIMKHNGKCYVLTCLHGLLTRSKDGPCKLADDITIYHGGENLSTCSVIPYDAILHNMTQYLALQHEVTYGIPFDVAVLTISSDYLKFALPLFTPNSKTLPKHSPKVVIAAFTPCPAVFGNNTELVYDLVTNIRLPHRLHERGLSVLTNVTSIPSMSGAGVIDSRSRVCGIIIGNANRRTTNSAVVLLSHHIATSLLDEPEK